MPEARICNHRIHYSIADDWAVVRPEEACNEDCTQALARLVNSPLIDSENLIIDLSHVEYVETPGFRWLVRQYRQLEAKGKVLVVAGLPPSVERAFKLLQLDRLIPLAKDVPEAIYLVSDRRVTAVA